MCTWGPIYGGMDFWRPRRSCGAKLRNQRWSRCPSCGQEEWARLREREVFGGKVMALLVSVLFDSETEVRWLDASLHQQARRALRARAYRITFSPAKTIENEPNSDVRKLRRRETFTEEARGARITYMQIMVADEYHEAAIAALFWQVSDGLQAADCG